MLAVYKEHGPDNDGVLYDDDGACIAYWWRMQKDRRLWANTEYPAPCIMDDFGNLVPVNIPDALHQTLQRQSRLTTGTPS